MQQKGPLTVLVAPLDWGLGHATRCIPIINHLNALGIRVVIAARGSQKKLLEQEFPHLEYLDIPVYDIIYQTGFLLKWGIIFHAPRLLRQIRTENRWLEETRQLYHIDAIISDNRYGLHNKNLFCVFVTHQLSIQTGSVLKMGSWRLAVTRWMDQIILKWNYHFINKFSVCWVPDEEGNSSLAGRLSHPPVLPGIPVKYIGILSRFRPVNEYASKITLLIMLSGPEPQRTLFENVLLAQLAGTSIQALLLRGLPENERPVPFIRNGVSVFNHLSADRLGKIISGSTFIIARSGYSTIMDLVRLKKTAILVPTPGQTEQEYLGHYLNEKKWMYSVQQKNFNIEAAIADFQKAELKLPDMPLSGLENVLDDFLKSVSERCYLGL
jgi:UDP-N-acetylglucosamine transferase subunit ALG13